LAAEPQLQSQKLPWRLPVALSAQRPEHRNLPEQTQKWVRFRTDFYASKRAVAVSWHRGGAVAISDTL